MNCPFRFFFDFDKVVLYYDNYKLFQVADLICTLKLLNLKRENNLLSNSEMMFFKSSRDLNKNYIKPILKKEFNNWK